MVVTSQPGCAYWHLTPAMEISTYVEMYCKGL